MTTKNEYIASIMLEAADLLQMDESAGANGAGERFYKEKIKAAQNKIKSLEKKAKAYKRAGYSDRGPAKEIKDLKDKIEDYEDNMDVYMRDYHNISVNRRSANRSKNGLEKGMISDNNVYGEEYANAFHKNDKLRKEKAEKNARINKRAAMKEAIDLLYDKAIECDTLDEATEYINKAEQLESLIGE